MTIFRVGTNVKRCPENATAVDRAKLQRSGDARHRSCAELLPDLSNQLQEFLAKSHICLVAPANRQRHRATAWLFDASHIHA